MSDGTMLGERVGMIVGAGVVGDGVIMFVGDKVGEGVGIHVEHSNVRLETLGLPTVVYSVHK